MYLPLPIYRWQRLFFSELVFVILTGSQVLLFCYSPDGRAAAISAVIGAFQRDPKDNIFFWYFTFYVASHFFFFSYLWFGQSTTAVVSLNLSTTHSFLRYIFKLSITKSSCELSFFWFCKLHGTIFHYFFWSFFGILCLVLWSCSITFFTVSKMKTNRGRSLETIGHKAKF